MRPVSGFNRPAVQWMFVLLAVVLISAAAGEAVGLRRARREIETLHTANLDGRVRQEQLESHLAREQATREALTLELARVRAGASIAPVQPTLTLTPLTTRGAQPPSPTVAPPSALEVIELRLVLPAAAADKGKYSVAIRTWSTGETVWSRGGLSPRTAGGRHMVAALVTGDVFAAGAYEVVVSRVSGDAGAGVASYEVAIGEGPPRRPFP